MYNYFVPTLIFNNDTQEVYENERYININIIVNNTFDTIIEEGIKKIKEEKESIIIMNIIRTRITWG